MPFERFLDLYALIRTHAKQRISNRMEIDKILVKRRDLLSKDRMDEYWDLVQKQNQREEETYLEISQIVYNELGLTE